MLFRVAALLGLACVAGALNCPNGFLPHGSSCYLFSHDVTTLAGAHPTTVCSRVFFHQREAQAQTAGESTGVKLYVVIEHALPAYKMSCKILGANVVEVNSDAENMYLYNVIKKTPSAGWYIGITDKLVEGEWRYMSSGRLVNFTNWFPGEPTDSNTGESCVVLSFGTDAARWVDADCKTGFNYICERPPAEDNPQIVG